MRVMSRYEFVIQRGAYSVISNILISITLKSSSIVISFDRDDDIDLLQISFYSARAKKHAD